MAKKYSNTIALAGLLGKAHGMTTFTANADWAERKEMDHSTFPVNIVGVLKTKLYDLIKKILNLECSLKNLI